MIRQETLNLYSGMVSRISSEYANKYRMVEKEDVAQECWMWFITHPRKVAEWGQLDTKDSDRLFARSLRNAALDFCLKEKAQVTGYEYEDNFWYTKEFIKQMLPAVISGDPQRVQRLSSEIKIQKSPAESGDWMAYSADILKAWDLLNEEEKQLVLLFYGKDLSSDDVHEQTNSERPTARATAMAANRALTKMVKTLGGFSPFKDKDAVDETKEDAN
jgi:DNA-directed RNA polymerase specialized sigma24 family protein